MLKTEDGDGSEKCDERVALCAEKCMIFSFEHEEKCCFTIDEMMRIVL